MLAGPTEPVQPAPEENPIDVMLTAPDVGVVKQFYGDQIGLDLLIESDDFVTFRCGGDNRLVVTRTTSPTSGIVLVRIVTDTAES